MGLVATEIERGAMISRNTVLVLGAGASCSYGLPVGSKLRDLILDIPEDELDKVPNGNGSSIILPGRGAEFLKAFRRSQYYSIDAFLAMRGEFVEVGKHAIAMTLLPRESPGALLDSNVGDHWYRHLLHAMDAPWKEIHKNKLSVVTFNYDRSLELILTSALAARYGKTECEARAVVEKFNIVHVYGSLGSLDRNSSDFVPYGGATNSSEYFFRAARGLKVIPESRADSPEFERAKCLLARAEALAFLGFGFDRTNVERLGGHSIGAGGRSRDPDYVGYYPFAATALGLTRAEIINVSSQITNVQNGNHLIATMHDMTCLEVLRHTLILGTD